MHDVHRRRPGHRGRPRTRLIGAVFRSLDRLLGRLARIGAGARAARFGARAAALDATPKDAIERALDRDGHIREAAVRELASAPRPEAIPVLLARANDWVPQVRAAAVTALSAHLRDELVPAWALALDAVEALRRGGRLDDVAVLAAIDGFLRAPERLDRIVAATRAAPLALQRLVGALRRAAAHDDAALAALLCADASGGDVVAALSATRAAQALADPTVRDRVWRAALASPHAALRRIGLANALAAGGEDRAALIERFAHDPSVAVRAAVLAAASAVERDAIAASARRALDAPSTSSVDREDRRRAVALHTLVALGEFDPSPASPWLRTPGARTRETAFAGCWQRADAATRETLALRAFADDAPRLQRWAARAVVRAGLVPHWHALLDVVVRSPSRHRLHAVRRALGRASPWWRLAFELGLGEATGSVDRAQLASWCVDTDRSFAAPAAADADAIAAAWRRASAALGEGLAAAVGSRLVRYGVIAD